MHVLCLLIEKDVGERFGVVTRAQEQIKVKWTTKRGCSSTKLLLQPFETKLDSDGHGDSMASYLATMEATKAIREAHAAAERTPVYSMFHLVLKKGMQNQKIAARPEKMAVMMRVCRTALMG